MQLFGWDWISHCSQKHSNNTSIRVQSQQIADSLFSLPFPSTALAGGVCVTTTSSETSAASHEVISCIILKQSILLQIKDYNQLLAFRKKAVILFIKIL